MSGRLVAAMTKTDFFEPTPSISVRIWLTMRSPASPPPAPPEPRGLAIESISSKKRMHGAAPRALSKSWRTLASDSPNHIESSSGPLTEMKLDLTSLAIALATSVLPQPDGPYSSIPFEGAMPYRANLAAYLSGYMSVSVISRLTSCSPPTSAHEQSGISTALSRSEEGAVFVIACVMCAGVTTSSSSMSASTSSASTSMSPARSRTVCIAASVTSWPRSAPQ
mmetsp:Transcript_9635/g.16466  ORF Transcript_9635/g.16466 Transcript_9635/m.16466 type:complete len:223 (+) Transcript_9635:759-1427(+)